MRLSKEQTAENRTRVLDAALGLFAERGFSGVAVSELMAEAGLTHGGFYNHFESKAALEAEACGLAFERAVGALRKVAARPAGVERRAAMKLYVERYLSEKARDARGPSCPMVAFSADVSRESAEIQKRYALGVAAYLDELARAMEAGRPQAMALTAELVGALTLARSVAQTDKALSKAVLDAARERIVWRLAP
ncbi:MAG: TetR family transcriptional regulator [Hyphomicrobiales bacterium]|nr:TetR family transcriptional regulator [Hyphomicrobiales bacterium]